MNGSDRIFFASVRSLQSLKAERRKHGRNQCQEETADSPEPERPDTASVREEMDPQAGVIPAVENPEVNEPETTQVVDQLAANNTRGTAPAGTQGVGPRPSWLNDAALPVDHPRTVEKTIRESHECTGSGPSGP
jgi:hypothetical protein